MLCLVLAVVALVALVVVVATVTAEVLVEALVADGSHSKLQSTARAIHTA